MTDDGTAERSSTDAELPAIDRKRWFRSWPHVQLLLIGLVAIGGIVCMCVVVFLLAASRQ